MTRSGLLVVLVGCGGEVASVPTADTGPPAARAGARDAFVCARNGDFRSIQAAIDASVPGDTIEVCPGAWGPIELAPGQDLRIVSTGGPDVTSIDGRLDTAVFVLEAALELRGFTLTGTGSDQPWSTDRGGALTVQEGEVTLADAIVEGAGGDFGLVFDEDLLVMEDVVWRDNDARVLWFLWQGDDAVITRNTVVGGVHESLAMAGRLHQLHLRQSVFRQVTIDTAFTAFDLHTSGTGPLVIENNVFYDVDDLDPLGGRMFVDDPHLLFRNNIVEGCDGADLGPFASAYSIFWDNGAEYRGVVSGPGNLFVDPRMVDPANGDMRLRRNSPGIDAGLPARGWNDRDGTRNDIGAFGGP